MIKYTVLMLISVIFLSACSSTQQGQSNNGNNVSQQTTSEESSSQATEEESSESEELTTEEQEELEMIEALPEEADTDDWNLMLVNEEHTLSEDQTPPLVEVQDGQLINERIVDAWNDWYNHALENGHSLYVVSGYRDVSHQVANYNNQVNMYMNQGDSEEEAIRKTDMYFARPGESEHHTGLAIDLVDHEWLNQGGVNGNILVEEYETQASQQFLEDTMVDFGFILRYKPGKEDITGVEYEPWHFRYVGQENAEYIEEHDLVLEEYIDLLEKRDNL